ncbi:MULTISPECIES: hypothetical protein [Burkholderia]|uniref:hypothetical protein n=1 Tax=Burkholderia TaxID=32008 RepID=UPI00215063AB|nr:MULTISPECIES: hypothetical protein [Burkholderia]MDR5643251.1 hypothetical protein [Burkholderia cenocepacia]UVS97395.1 hypothetical protein EFP19_17685 [Burkholderia glumae]
MLTHPSITQNDAALAIGHNAPAGMIAAWLDGGLSPAGLYAPAVRCKRADVLALLFDRAHACGPQHVRDGVLEALRVDRVFDDRAVADVVLSHAHPSDLNRPRTWVPRRDGSAVGVPLWWHRFRQATAPTAHDLHAVLVLLRDHGAGLHATPFTDEGGGGHGDALRAFLLAERIAAERAVLRQAAAETGAVALAKRTRL